MNYLRSLLSIQTPRIHPWSIKSESLRWSRHFFKASLVVLISSQGKTIRLENRETWKMRTRESNTILILRWIRHISSCFSSLCQWAPIMTTYISNCISVPYKSLAQYRRKPHMCLLSTSPLPTLQASTLFYCLWPPQPLTPDPTHDPAPGVGTVWNCLSVICHCPRGDPKRLLVPPGK